MHDPRRRAVWVAAFVLGSLAPASRTLARPAAGNAPQTPGKAMREAEEALRSGDREKRFGGWDTSFRQRLSEMEKETQAGRGDDLTRRYQLEISKSDSAQARCLYGRLLGKLDRIEEAREQFDRALSLDPDYYYAHEGLAIYHMRRQRPDEAIKELTIALTTNPKFHRARFTFGRILCGGGEYDRAMEELMKVPKESDQYVGSRLLVGQCRLARKEFDLAIAEFRALQKFDPDNLEAAYCLAEAQRFSGELDAAIATCEGILAKRPEEYYAAFVAGLAYRDKGELAKARRSLETVLEKAPESSKIDRDKIKALIAQIDAAQRGAPLEESTVTLRELVDQLEKDPDPRTRRNAIRALSMLDLRELVPTFARAVLDKDYGVRVIAVRQLGRLGGRDALSVVKRLLKDDPNRLVRGAACGAISEIGETEGLTPLVESLHDPEPYVVDEAIRAVTRLSGQPFAGASAGEWSDTDRTRIVSAIEAWWAAESKRHS